MSNIKNLEVNYDMLSDEKKRDLYLRKLATGEIQGPPTGKPSQDKPWLKYYSEEAIVSDVPKMKAYDYLVLNNLDNLNSVAINYYGRKITYSSLIKKNRYLCKSIKKDRCKMWRYCNITYGQYSRKYLFILCIK